MAKTRRLHCRRSRKSSPTPVDCTKSRQNRLPIPVKPHLASAFSPVLAHLEVFGPPNRGKNSVLRPSCKHSPWLRRCERSLSSAAGRLRMISSRKISPCARTHCKDASRTRSRCFPHRLTTVPEPHHSCVPQDLTWLPGKLHLAAGKPAPGKALPWR